MGGRTSYFAEDYLERPYGLASLTVSCQLDHKQCL